MEISSLKEIKTELISFPNAKLVDLIIRLSKYKKENKELLSYLLFDAIDEELFIKNVKCEIDSEFSNLNLSSWFLAKKTIRKVLRTTNKFIRYSKRKSTEAELLMYFCHKMKEPEIILGIDMTMRNLYSRQIDRINKAILSLHEDLQFDFRQEMAEMNL
ncbi:MAG: hypothetical protein AUJ98_02325 [Bacteroidetes bacterium CG2_30_33_31]|nr:MAG: hypothetical protein AUJ98_02325 [Bacteroidetes bacterium CG2_30_33_31]